jgi:hypothetical protein
MPDAACPEPALDNVGPPKAGRVAGGTGFSATEAAAAPAYTRTARILHWVMAILILSMIPLGLVIARSSCVGVRSAHPDQAPRTHRRRWTAPRDQSLVSRG